MEVAYFYYGTSVIIACSALVYAVHNAKKQATRLASQAENMCKQTDFMRKQLFGEVYEEARVSDLHFLLPSKCQHEVEGFKQREEEETLLGEYIAIPVDSERELHIGWEMVESQTLRGYKVGFEGNHRVKPTIVGVEQPFYKTVFQASVSEEYIDWNGDFHREFVRQLRVPSHSYHYIALTVKGMANGKHILHVRVRVDEAPKPFEGKLTVDCLREPNDWAKEHWC